MTKYTNIHCLANAYNITGTAISLVKLSYCHTKSSRHLIAHKCNNVNISFIFVFYHKWRIGPNPTADQKKTLCSIILYFVRERESLTNIVLITWNNGWVHELIHCLWSPWPMPILHSSNSWWVLLQRILGGNIGL